MLTMADSTTFSSAGQSVSMNVYVATGYVAAGCTCGPWGSTMPPPPCPVHSSVTPPQPQAVPYVGGGQITGSPSNPPVSPVTADKGIDSLPAGEPPTTDDEAIEGLRKMLEELGE